MGRTFVNSRMVVIDGARRQPPQGQRQEQRITKIHAIAFMLEFSVTERKHVNTLPPEFENDRVIIAERSVSARDVSENLGNHVALQGVPAISAATRPPARYLRSRAPQPRSKGQCGVP